MGRSVKEIDAMDRLFDELFKTYAYGDWEGCRQVLSALCTDDRHERLLAEFTRDAVSAMGYFEMFVKTGLDRSPPGSSARRLYEPLARYVGKSMPKGFRDRVAEEFRLIMDAVEPVGYTDDGQPCYRTDRLAEALGIDEREILECADGEMLLSADKVHKVQ